MRYGTSLAYAPAPGYQPPSVLQPTGNYDAFLPVEDAPHDPYFDFPRAPYYQVHRPECAGQRVPDGQHPDGTNYWEMSYPNGPILYGPNNNIISPSPALPGQPRGSVTMGAETLGYPGGVVEKHTYAEMTAAEAKDTFIGGVLGALGAGLALWLIAKASKR